MDIIRYIAELSASSWRITGYYGFLLELEIERITGNICKEEIKTVALSVTQDGARRLGLKEGLSPAEVKRVLALYGAKLNDERFDMAVYDARDHGMVVVSSAAETYFIASLVRLANSGMTIERGAK